MTISCHTAEAMLGRQLTAQEHQTLDEHLEHCGACMRLIAQIDQECRQQVDERLLTANGQVHPSDDLMRRLQRSQEAGHGSAANNSSPWLVRHARRCGLAVVATLLACCVGQWWFTKFRNSSSSSQLAPSYRAQDASTAEQFEKASLASRKNSGANNVGTGSSGQPAIQGDPIPESSPASTGLVQDTSVAQQPTAHSSLVRPAVIARHGFVVARRSGDPDDIPFFLVAPTAQHASPDDESL